MPYQHRALGQQPNNKSPINLLFNLLYAFHGHKAYSPKLFLLLLMMMTLVLGACNLGNQVPEDNDPETIVTATNTAGAPTRTPLPDNTAAPTLTPILPPQQATSVAVLPPVIATAIPTNTALPINISILSPVPGSVVSGNVQVLGSAIHPQFLQYRLEFGPDPNPGNLWFPITGIVQAPVLNGGLGIWNTNTASSPDDLYQLRLRVFLRDGRQEITVVNNIRVQNTAPTPIPTNTPPVPRPTASFTQDRISGNAPLVVRFTNQSQGQINSYSWNFGDGGNSNEINPTHTFTQPGIYTVTLRVRGPGGDANVSRQIQVTSPSAPIANYTTNVSSGEAPLTVNFTDTSTGVVTSRRWDFGDGSPISTAQNPTHNFTEVGSYNVILEVSGPGGTSSAIKQITVENPQIAAPNANFTPNTTTGETPLTVTFNNTTTGEVNQYLWDVNGDGTTDSTEVDPTHVYTNAGTYTVRLTAIGPGGQSTAQATIVVQQPPDAPLANFTASPTSGNAPLLVQFNNQTSGQVTGYAWDFNNDGQIDSNSTSPTYSYQASGTYTARLTASGPGGSTNHEVTITVTTPLAAPEAGFDANPTIGQAPLLVQFNNTSEGSQLSYEWDFDGNGTVDSTDINPSYEYSNAGNYVARLTVRNPVGQDQFTQTIQVSDAVSQLPPTAAFTALPSDGFAPLTVNFSNQSFGEIDRYEWDFDGNGTVDSAEANPSHQYTTPGTYNATLRAFGPGGEDDIMQPIVVTQRPQAPTASFTTNTSTGTVPFTVTFTNTSQGQVNNLAWDFDGDGSPDNTTDNVASYTYTEVGTYNATLTVSNIAGSNTTTQTITANANAPVASFTVNTLSGDAPLAVEFRNTTQGAVNSFAWDFDGDGNPDNTSSNVVVYEYTNPGTYRATLTVTNSGGTDTAAQTITVSAPVVAPVADFTVSTTSGTAPLSVTFSSTSQGQIDNFAWDFDGDGNPDNTTDATVTHQYNTPGTYNATLTVSNDVGSDTLSQTITVNQPLSPPVANFTVDTNSGPAPLSVIFTGSAEGRVDNFAWDFDGDGNPDNTTDATVTHQYNTPGTYNATLTVSNESGDDTFSQTITVNPPLSIPVADFTVSTTSGTAPLTVTFDSTSQGEVDTFAWDFDGDGNPDNTTDTTVIHQYNNAGTYNASLTVSNNAGSDTLTQTITVNPQLTAPVADFTVNPNSGTAPLTVTFTGTAQGQVDSFAWDFDGDGNADNTTDATIAHRYDNPGTYNATLSVSNAAGTDTITQTIIVNPQLTAPVADFAVNTNSGNAPLEVTFTSTAQGQVDNFAWDFDGDGNPDNTTDAIITHRYNNPGTYNASLTVRNAAGTDTITQTITVNPPVTVPVANFTVSPNTGNAPLSVTFTSTAQGQVDNLAWDFDGDGNPDNTTDAIVAHQYNTPGTYNASLTVSNNAGMDTLTQTITVNPQLTAPVADFTISNNIGTAPFTVTFTNTSQGQVSSLAWDFDGDGIPENTSDNEVTHEYTQAGQYAATLTVGNAAGADITNQIITVNPAPPDPPVASFTAEPILGIAPLTVTFTSTTQDQITNFAWDFNGDGTPDNTSETTVTYQYGNPGSYNATFTVSNAGGQDTTTQTITVNPPAPDAPVASFTVDQSNGTAPLNVTFTSTAQGQVTNFAWDFNGDGIPDNSTDTTVMHQYTDPGTYTATLTVSNAGGQDTATQTITVNPQVVQPPPPPPPEAPTQGQIAFVSNASGNNEIYIALPNADGQRNITNNPANDYLPRWSPNGDRIVFVSDRNGDDDIYIMNAVGNNVVQLTTSTSRDTTPSWSPDGQRIVFASNRNGNYDLYVINADGTGLTQITSHPANDLDPAWSPNGDRIAFVSARDASVTNLYTLAWVNGAAGDVTNLFTSNATERFPAWSPNGDRIAIVSDANGSNDIYIMNADGSNITRLTLTANEESFPDWSPDGSKIIFMVAQTSEDIYTINVDGSNATALITTGSNDTQPSWGD